MRLSEAIARHCEPGPTWNWHADELGAQWSVGGFWTGVKEDPENDEEPIAQYPGRCTEPHSTVELLGRLVRLLGWEAASGSIWLSSEEWKQHKSPAKFWTDEKIAESIALAFADVEGIEWEEK